MTTQPILNSKKRTYRLMTLLSEDEKQKLKTIAEKKGLMLSSYWRLRIIELIEQELKQNA